MTDFYEEFKNTISPQDMLLLVRKYMYFDSEIVECTGQEPKLNGPIILNTDPVHNNKVVKTGEAVPDASVS